LIPKPSYCAESGCPLAGSGGFSHLEGNGTSGLCVMAESLGQHEENDALPLRPRAAAGSVFARALKLLGVDRQSLLITNTIRCRPNQANQLLGMPFEFEAIEKCKHFFREAIAAHPQIKVVLAMGMIPHRTLTGLSGTDQSSTKMRGYVLQAVEYDGLVVVPTYHPSYIQQGAGHLFRVFVEDIRRALEIAKLLAQVRTVASWEQVEGQLKRVEKPLLTEAPFILNPMDDPRLSYQTDPSPADAEAFYERCKADPALTISYDIETDRSAGKSEDEGDNEELGQKITLIQFSTGVGSGIALPFISPFDEVARRTLALPNSKVGHNVWLFDNPILGRAGLPVAGLIDDTLFMWRTLQPDLPADLQFVASWFGQPFPWKHYAGPNLRFYGCLASDVRLMLWDGGNTQIGDVVLQKSSPILKGMDEQGQIIPVRVVGWRRISRSGKTGRTPWLSIKTEATDQPIYCTADHKIWTDDGWQRADQLRIGDSVVSANPGSADLLHGTLLGDASVDRRGRFKFTHCNKQEAYFDAKRENLNGPKYVLPPISNPPIRGSRVNSTGGFATEVWVSPTLWRKRFYPNGKKIFIPPPSDAALAIWYCDDGNWAGGKKPNQIGNPRITIQGFANLADIVPWFKSEFGDSHVSYYKDPRSKQGGCVALCGDARYEFCRRVAPFVPPSMEYKLPPQYRGQYNGWLATHVAQWTVVLSIAPRTKRASARYDITVDHPTHRFFTMGGLVENCVDTDATLRIHQGLPAAMKKVGVWDTYCKYVRGLRPVLDAMTKRGVGVDREQLVAFGILLKETIARVRAELAPLVPAALQQFDDYKGLPKDVRELAKQRLAKLEPNIVAAQQAALAADPSLPKLTKKRLAELIAPVKARLEQEAFGELGYVQRDLRVDVGKGGLFAPTEDVQPAVQTVWSKPLDFNPGSWQQVMAYAKHKRHQVPVVSKKKNGIKVREESVNEKALLQLARRTKDPFYKLILDYREPSKMLGTYVGDIETMTGGFMPGPDGRVRADFTTRPANGQLSTRNGAPLQQIPKHGVLAKPLRKCITAAPGNLLIEADWKSFHILTLGFESKDKTYVRLARGDMHSFFTTQILKLEKADKLLAMDDAEMIERLVWWRAKPEQKYAGPKGRLLTFKEVRNEQSKAVILGMGLGRGPRGIWEGHEDFISSQAEAQKLVDLWRALFPLEVKFQRDVKELAHRQHYLKSRYGFIRWFWNVMVWDAMRQQYKYGTDAEAAISHFVQNDAFGMMRDVMLEMYEKGWDERYGLSNQIHDSLVFDCPSNLVDECIANIKPLMERPSPVLVDPVVAPEGLWCQVEVSVGKSLGAMEEIKL